MGSFFLFCFLVVSCKPWALFKLGLTERGKSLFYYVCPATCGACLGKLGVGTDGEGSVKLFLFCFCV